MVESDAVRVVCGVASVAQEENVLPLARVAYRAGVGGFLCFVLGIFSKPLPRVELGDLFPLLDLDAFDGRSCIRKKKRLANDSHKGRSAGQNDLNTKGLGEGGGTYRTHHQRRGAFEMALGRWGKYWSSEPIT